MEEMKNPAEAVEKKKSAARHRKRRNQYLKEFRNLVIRLALLLLVVYVLFFHLVGITIMPSGDMYPRIDAGDLVLFYRLEKSFKAQDIVVFEKSSAVLKQIYEMQAAEAEQAPIRTELGRFGVRNHAGDEKTLLVCRVVAKPGDTVEVTEDARLMVNGNAMVETNIFYPTPEYTGFVEYPVTLGQGEYFVLADYRNGGADSRFFGTVKENEILGSVITILRRNNL